MSFIISFLPGEDQYKKSNELQTVYVYLTSIFQCVFCFLSTSFYNKSNVFLFSLYLLSHNSKTVWTLITKYVLLVGFRICWLYPTQNPKKKCPRYDTKRYLMVRLQFSRSGEYGVFCIAITSRFLLAMIICGSNRSV